MMAIPSITVTTHTPIPLEHICSQPTIVEFHIPNHTPVALDLLAELAGTIILKVGQ